MELHNYIKKVKLIYFFIDFFYEKNEINKKTFRVNFPAEMNIFIIILKGMVTLRLLMCIQLIVWKEDQYYLNVYYQMV